MDSADRSKEEQRRIRQAGWRPVVIARVVVGLLLAGYAGASLYPFLWMVSAAFKDRAEVVSGGHLIPEHPTLDTLAAHLKETVAPSLQPVMATPIRDSLKRIT